MDAQNVLSAKNRSEFRSWLAGNSQIASECWVTVKRGKPTDETEFWYIDAEEEALCFGWMHHYITQAMDSDVMATLFEAIHGHRYITVDNLANIQTKSERFG